MDRGASAAVLAELGASQCRPVHLLELEFSPAIYLTDAPVPLSWNGHTYLPSQFLRFGDIAENRDLTVNECVVGLSGVDQTVISLLLADDYLGRTARIRKAMLSEALAVVANPIPIIEGRIDAPAIATDPEAGTCEASITIVSRWAPLDKPAGRTTNDDDQQAHFPGDRGFENVTDEQTTLVWGGSTMLTPPKYYRQSLRRHG